eukprot:TRINITY_DN1454_c0_g4_i1.p1 TRINITY_DN1454_c0_g4~~TRINITY_DN1454_c0_g4_i1.p1  ORF type:complete len:469 (-),score=149.42 TRINITY_DN1454_c0_g4_i1:44-1450(-)
MASISQQLNDLFNPKPAEEYDPENGFAEEEMQRKAPASTEVSLERRRIFADVPLNPKFAAKKTSRKELGRPDESSSEVLEKGMKSEEELGSEEEEAEEASIGEREKKQKAAKRDDQEVSEDDVDAVLEAIREEDQIQNKKAEKSMRQSEIERGKQVLLQRKVTDSLVGLRIFMEKLLSIANKLPQQQTIRLFQENSEVKDKYKACIAGLNDLLAILLSIQAQISTQAGISSELQKGVNKNSLEDIWKVLEKNKSQVKERSYDVIENWMEKAQVYANAKLKHNMKALGVHPLRQTEEKFTRNKQKFIQKAQTKAKAFKVFGNPSSSIHDMIDKEIYDDSDFYQMFLRDYLALNSKAVAESKEEEELNWTYKYLQSKGIAKKEKIGAPLIESKKRKDKTLKYTVHDKLVNFMAREENHFLIPGYKNITQSLFGIRRDEPLKRKRIGTEELGEEMEKIGNQSDEDMDVALI